MNPPITCSEPHTIKTHYRNQDTNTQILFSVFKHVSLYFKGNLVHNRYLVDMPIMQHNKM